MSFIYADTSAFGKRYLVESGTRWVRSWIHPSAGNTIGISEIGIIEFQSILTRRLYEGSVSQSLANQLEQDFLYHVRHSEYQLVSFSLRLRQEALQLVKRQNLRTLDAIHLASAVISGQLMGVKPTFISADKRLLAAAAAEGFTTDDPLAHP